MRLTENNLAFYLTDKGFLHPDFLINGHYRVLQQQSRNSIFRVELGEGRSGLFVKQLLSFDHHNSYSLQKEATAYYLVHHNPLFKELKSYLPDYYGYDAATYALVTQYFPDAQDLNEFLFNYNQLPASFADSIAHILRLLHVGIESQLKTDSSLQFFQKTIPWILQQGDPINPYQSQSVTHTPVSRWIAQTPQVAATLENIRVNWQTRHLIHGDLKLVNLLLPLKNLPHDDSNNTIKLIDWEISELGDPIWDLAGVVQSVICASFWSEQNAQTPYQQMSSQQMSSPTEQLIFNESAAKSFCQQLFAAYFHDSDSTEETGDLLKTLQFTGARLLQSAFEMNVNTTQLSPLVTKVLQYAHAFLLSPKQMKSYLLTGNNESAHINATGGAQ